MIGYFSTNSAKYSKGAANFEQETLTKVVEARAKATQIKVDANNPDDIAKFQQAQSEVSSSLSRLLGGQHLPNGRSSHMPTLYARLSREHSPDPAGLLSHLYP